jgi:hypothetical protein
MRRAVAKAVIVVVGLGVGHLQPSGRAVAQNKAKSYVQVTKISKSAEPLHLNSKDASCGTVSVDVYARKIDTPDPMVSLELDQYSSNPPGVRVKISPESQSAKITSTVSAFTFKVCAAGNIAGTATLLAIIQRVGPDHSYEIREPEPAESARVTVDVVP